ncbi:MAG: hypothetical protein HRT71_07345 [Flavobacteriales bacterium]|nr:hypothetical protein [Flavobacteriales bacterium]
MAQHVKLIWDLRGPDAKPMAEHHCIHLKEYIAREKLELIESGVKELTSMHSIAYLVITEKDMIQVRDALKPHRGEVVES